MQTYCGVICVLFKVNMGRSSRERRGNQALEMQHRAEHRADNTYKHPCTQINVHTQHTHAHTHSTIMHMCIHTLTLIHIKAHSCTHSHCYSLKHTKTHPLIICVHISPTHHWRYSMVVIQWLNRALVIIDLG